MIAQHGIWNYSLYYLDSIFTLKRTMLNNYYIFWYRHVYFHKNILFNFYFYYEYTG